MVLSILSPKPMSQSTFKHLPLDTCSWPAYTGIYFNLQKNCVKGKYIVKCKKNQNLDNIFFKGSKSGQKYKKDQNLDKKHQNLDKTIKKDQNLDTNIEKIKIWTKYKRIKIWSKIERTKIWTRIRKDQNLEKKEPTSKRVFNTINTRVLTPQSR